ncbi:hypothetical protein ACU635_13910 [[Actinomadura] parvosata]
MPILLSLPAFVMTLLGGLVADRFGRRRHLVLGFAAGVMPSTSSRRSWP